MTPFILPGSRLLVERVPLGEIRKGDVVCYIGDGALGVAHRVVRLERSEKGLSLVTRGDAQRGEETVPGEAVIAVVRRVDHLLVSYDTGGPIGRTIARVALGEDKKARAVKRVCALGWGAVRLVERELRGVFT